MTLEIARRWIGGRWQTGPAEESSGGSQTVLSASVTLTNAQIKALRSTPIEVVPAPEADEVIVVLGGLIVADCAAGEYTNITPRGNANTSSLSLCYGNDDAQASGFLQSEALLSVAAVIHALIPVPHVLVVPQGTAETVDAGAVACLGSNVRIEAYNSDGDYTGGNAANTMAVTVFYAIASTA